MSNVRMKSLLFVFLFSLAFGLQAKLPDHVSRTFNNNQITPDKIIFDIPDIAENGAVVPVTIAQVKLENKDVYVQELWLFNQARKQPVAHFKLNESSIIDGLSTRIRLQKTSHIYAVARLSNGRYVGGEKKVKVVKGGC